RDLRELDAGAVGLGDAQIEIPAAAALAYLDEDAVDALREMNVGDVLVEGRAAVDPVFPYDIAVQPDLIAVVGTETQLGIRFLGHLNLSVGIGELPIE